MPHTSASLISAVLRGTPISRGAWEDYGCAVGPGRIHAARCWELAIAYDKVTAAQMHEAFQKKRLIEFLGECEHVKKSEHYKLLVEKGIVVRTLPYPQN